MMEEITTAIEKNPGKDPPDIVFFCSGSTLIQSGSLLSCLAAEKHFLLFKGPGPFKKSKKKCGNVEKYKAYRSIPITPTHPPFSFYSTFKETTFHKKKFVVPLVIFNWVLACST
jgi:hypothetical protein